MNFWVIHALCCVVKEVPSSLQRSQVGQDLYIQIVKSYPYHVNTNLM